MTSLICARDLSVRFGALEAVRDVSLDVASGEVVTLLGTNGAGKTTLVETLLGFRAPSSGTARILDCDPVTQHGEVVARTGALLQRGGVWFPMTPRQALTLTATYYPDARNVEELLTLLDLRDCATTPWRRLSGGQQQRVLLALAIIGNPDVLVLDEPTTAVDPEGRTVIRELIATERARGRAILITTHELTEAERLSDRVVIMNHGRVLVSGTVDDVSGDPVLVLETSAPIDPVALGQHLNCAVRPDGPTTYVCDVTNAPATMSAVTDFMGAQGVTVIAMRSRATLEERYLDIIQKDRA